MFNVTINGKSYQVEEGKSIIETCESLGVKIPRFCYIKGLSVPANCRMCLVEVKGSRKLLPACHTNVASNMEIFTESQNVEEARKSIMSFLLINHPLDCPICDEAGECELQNQAVAYGFNDTSYEFSKRSREAKELGPLISTNMTRCINCTRCIRFMDEVAGLPSLGVLGRGEESDISNYFQEPINSELSGNLVDICPVGALNNAQYLFRDRPWQLSRSVTIDIVDTMALPIVVNMEEEEVVRILPNNSSDIHEAWIPDKSRYICDSVDIQRIDSPWIKENGKFRRATFEEAYTIMKNNIINLTGSEIAALSGRFADVESMLLLKELLLSLDSKFVESRLNGILFSNKDRNSYIFNTSYENIEEADSILIVGSNPKKEVPVLNAKIRKRVLQANVPVGVIGDIELNYPNIKIDNSISALIDILNDKHEFSKTLKDSKKPMLIVGEDAFRLQNTNEVLSLLYAICNKFNIVSEDWNGYNFINTSIGAIGALDIGFLNNDCNIKDLLNRASTREIKFLWLLNVDEIDFSKLENTFIVYIGHHGDKGAQHANVVLPAALWLEKEATFVNLEGKPVKTSVVKAPLKDIKEDWVLIKEFSNFIGKSLPYNSLEDIRAKMAECNNVFRNYNVISKNDISYVKSVKAESSYNIVSNNVSTVVKDYYLTDVLSRNSATMAKCSQLFKSLSKNNRLLNTKNFKEKSL